VTGANLKMIRGPKKGPSLYAERRAFLLSSSYVMAPVSTRVLARIPTTTARILASRSSYYGITEGMELACLRGGLGLKGLGVH
jgi:hypothetical protein